MDSCRWKVIQTFHVMYDDTLHKQKQDLILPLTLKENDHYDQISIENIYLFVHGLMKSWKR